VHELHAGDARADHHQVLRHDRRRVSLAGGQDAVAVGLAPVGDAGPAAGGDEDGVGLDGVGAVDLHSVRPGKAGRAPDHPYALISQEILDGGA
jgi:hypothetical protein